MLWHLISCNRSSHVISVLRVLDLAILGPPGDCSDNCYWTVLSTVPSAISAGRTGRCQGCPSRPRPLRTAGRPSSTVTGRHRAVTIDTYTVTVERAVQDINRFIYISRLSISSKHSGSDGADVEGSCFTAKIVEKCTYYN